MQVDVSVIFVSMDAFLLGSALLYFFFFFDKLVQLFSILWEFLDAIKI
jgi:hypothetical protein